MIYIRKRLVKAGFFFFHGKAIAAIPAIRWIDFGNPVFYTGSYIKYGKEKGKWDEIGTAQQKTVGFDGNFAADGADGHFRERSYSQWKALAVSAGDSGMRHDLCADPLG